MYIVLKRARELKFYAYHNLHLVAYLFICTYFYVYMYVIYIHVLRGHLFNDFQYVQHIHIYIYTNNVYKYIYMQHIYILYIYKCDLGKIFCRPPLGRILATPPIWSVIDPILSGMFLCLLWFPIPMKYLLYLLYLHKKTFCSPLLLDERLKKRLPLPKATFLINGIEERVKSILGTRIVCVSETQRMALSSAL